MLTKAFRAHTANSVTTSYGGPKQTRRDPMICRPLATVLVGRRPRCSEGRKPGEAAGRLPAGVWVWRWSPLTLSTITTTLGVCQTLH